MEGEPLDYTGLLFPTMMVKNKKGETIFTMKRKGEKYGQLYYLFEFHWDRCEPSRIAKLNAVWQVTKIVAAQMGIPLYDTQEVFDEIKKQTKRALKHTPIGKTEDITISILDHATGKMNSLVVGVTKKPLEKFS